MKNIITEIKDTVEGIKNRLGDAEEQICNLEVRILEITQSEQRKDKKRLKKFQGSA